MAFAGKPPDDSELIAKYDVDLATLPASIDPAELVEEIRRRDALDQHFTRLWLDFTIAMHARPRLDARRRLLTQIGQFTVTRNHERLADTMRLARARAVDDGDILEVLFQASVYAGDTVLRPALRIYAEVWGPDAGGGTLPLTGRAEERDLNAERARWSEADAADPRLEPLIDRYGWLGVSTGLLKRPGHHLDILSRWDGIDPTFALLWERFTYAGMYSRDLLDEPTRMLCVVANFVALAETTQIREHMKGALRVGVAPVELLEVIVFSSINFGMPSMGQAFRILVEILTELGRVEELRAP